MGGTAGQVTQEAVEAELARREEQEAAQVELARNDPAYLMSFCVAQDERTGEDFEFAHLREPLAEGELVEWDGKALAQAPLLGKTWRWQRGEMDCFHAEQRVIRLKARQLGETWLACGYALWTALYQPGSLCLIYRQKENDAFDNIKRVWQLFESLPGHLRNGATVEKPSRVPDPIPTEELRFRFPETADKRGERVAGKSSSVQAQTSASASGHGRTAAVVVLDEFSRIDKAEEIMSAVSPAAGSRGKILIISTANGRSNEETGEGNHFHYLWAHAEGAGLHKRFLPWALHPDRDQDWYANDPEVRTLKTHKRAEQYPQNEHEAFTLTNRVYFDPDDLDWYAKNGVRAALYRCNFVDRGDRLTLARGAEAVLHKTDRGYWRVLEEPVAGHGYAIFADVATGHGRDYSAAYCIDLTNQALAAEFHGRLDEDLYAAQLHYLGRWYGRAHKGGNPADPEATGAAKIAVEAQGGFGNAVIAALRDRTAGRPAYPNLYRHVLDNRSDRPIAKPWGFPMNSATRPKALNAGDRALREHTVPWVTAELLHELGDFVRHDHGTSPRAAEGTNDDRVMAFVGSLELYRIYGHHESKPRHKPRRSRIVGLGRAA